MQKYLSLSGDVAVGKVDNIGEIETADNKSNEELDAEVLKREIIAIMLTAPCAMSNAGEK